MHKRIFCSAATTRGVVRVALIVMEGKHEETQYLDLLTRILTRGVRNLHERTGKGTLGVVGNSMRFSLEGNRVPLLTTKGVFWRGVVEELLFFIRGETDTKKLSARGVHIWELNTQATGGCMGPMYGWQWRHFGATWEGPEKDYTKQGVDQLARALRLLREEPMRRDILMTTWNPMDLDKGVLSPCHVLVQFCVQGEGSAERPYRLSSVVTQRSADVGLGVPFNIASYALLTLLIAKAVRMQPSELVYNTGDTHIYMNHIQALMTQLGREPRPFPTVDLQAWHTDGSVESFESLQASQIVLHGYEPHPSIKMDMNV